MDEVRSVFVGNDPWSALALRASLAAAEPLTPSLVLTRVPRPAGRGSRPRPTAVAEAARTLGLPLLEVETLRNGEGAAALADARPDVLVVVAYGELLPPGVLAIPSLGVVNLHFSLLPRWRGASPVRCAILAGDGVTGVTTIVVDEGLDTGPILEREEVPIDPHEDAGALGARLAELGGGVLARSVHGWARGAIVPRPQPEEGVTLAPKLTPAERTIDWRLPAAAIERLVRSLAPVPGARTVFHGQGLVIAGGAVAPAGAPAASPGTLAVEGEDVLVATGEGWFRPAEVTPAGKRRMSARDWARGARPGAGDRLGEEPGGPADRP